MSKRTPSSSIFSSHIFFIVFTYCLFGVSSVNAEGPAVSGLNGKAEAFIGEADGDASGGGAASLSVPIGHSIGFQIDGLVAGLDDKLVGGVGLHAFWRDPEVALLGLIYSHVDFDIGDFDRAGVEGEYYMSNMTFKAKVGWQGGHNVSDSGFGGGSFGYYLMDNLLLQAGVKGGSGNVLGSLLAEWQPGMIAMAHGLTAYANIGIGNDSYEHVLFGVRYYFGENKSLKLRHRQDDPENDLIDQFGLNNRQTPEEPEEVNTCTLERDPRCFCSKPENERNRECNVD
jgi:hypothetical protein